MPQMFDGVQCITTQVTLQVHEFGTVTVRLILPDEVVEHVQEVVEGHDVIL